MRKTALAALLLIAALQLAIAVPVTVKEFKSQDGGFSIMTPVVMEEMSQEIDTAIGKILIVMYGGSLGDAAFQVGYNDYPEGFVTKENTGQLLDGAVSGMVTNINAELQSEVDIALKGYKGKEIFATIMLGDIEADVKARLFVVGSRLYQLIVVAPKGSVEIGTIDAFLQSLKLL